MALSNLKKITGDLIVNNNKFNELKLSNLNKIEGKLLIENNESLDKIDLSQVDNINNKIKIKNNGNKINMTWNDDKEYDWITIEKEITLGGPGSYSWTNTVKDIKYAVPLILKTNIESLLNNNNVITIVLIDKNKFNWNDEKLLKDIIEKFYFEIDWGDNTTLFNIKGNPGNFINNKLFITHTYYQKGEYIITLKGTKKQEITYIDNNGNEQSFLTTGLISINGWNNNLDKPNDNIKNLIKFGSNIYYSWEGTYKDMTAVKGTPNDLPVTSKNFIINDKKYIRNNYNSYALFNNLNNFNFNILKNLNTNYVSNMNNMFGNASIFNQNISNWNVINITNMSYMFFFAKKFNSNISNWDVRNVKNMSNMFNSATDFNHDISDWDVSNVLNMNEMFNQASGFNQDVGSWDISNVTDMTNIFNNTSTLSNDNKNYIWTNWSRPDKITKQNVNAIGQLLNSLKITDLSNTFIDSEINEDISSWDVSEIKNMSGLFANKIKFNQDISNWNISNVTDTSRMFYGAKVFNQDISIWNVSKVTDMSLMFKNSEVFNKNISNWNVLNVNNMKQMFQSSSLFNNKNINYQENETITDINNELNSIEENLNEIDLSNGNNTSNNFNLPNITNMSKIFYRDTEFNKVMSNCKLLDINNKKILKSKLINNYKNLNSWKVDNVTDMSDMFNGATSFDQDISDWNISSVTNMKNIFNNTKILNSVNKGYIWNSWSNPEKITAKNVDAIGQLMISFNIKDLSNKFIDSNFNQDISNWDVSKINDMSFIFYSAKIFNQNINNWEVNNVTDMSNMFNGAKSFDQDISNWEVNNVTDMSNMFINSGLSIVNTANLLINWNKNIIKKKYSFQSNIKIAFNQDLFTLKNMYPNVIDSIKYFENKLFWEIKFNNEENTTN